MNVEAKGIQVFMMFTTLGFWKVIVCTSERNLTLQFRTLVASYPKGTNATSFPHPHSWSTCLISYFLSPIPPALTIKALRTSFMVPFIGCLTGISMR